MISGRDKELLERIIKHIDKSNDLKECLLHDIVANNFTIFSEITYLLIQLKNNSG